LELQDSEFWRFKDETREIIYPYLYNFG